jgi:aspartyl-tRNA(Asn)/glutamyl-tRNA(Gln) amidotransferase subunit A
MEVEMEPYRCLTAVELLERLERSEVTAVSLAESALQRIEALDGKVNAFRHLDRDKTLEMARAADERYRTRQTMGLLDGLPVAVKDAFNQISWTTRNGSSLTDDSPDTLDAPTVSACRRNGFVPVGKTNMPEFGWKAVTDSPLTGITRNPWNPDKTPGGSSGGSAAAVALGIVPLALAADSGGSTRIPASFCGVVGFKPTHGRSPMLPGSHYGKLSQPGPMARTVRDAALLLDVMTESDPRDPRLQPMPRRYRDELEGGVSGLRIAYSPNLGLDIEVDPEVAAAVEHVANKLSELGARVIRADPDIGDLREHYQRLFFTTSALMIRDWDDATRARMDPHHREVAEHYGRLSALDYLAADHARVGLMHRMSLFHQDFDLILCPTAPVRPFTAGREAPEGWPHPRWTSWAWFTWPWNMTGQPAISVPCGFTRDGLPIGAQFIGSRNEDHLVLRAAQTFQQALPLTDRLPPMIDAGSNST